MSETAREDVFVGHVLEWHTDEGWGVLASPSLPDVVWAHYSTIQAEDFRELTTGQAVRFLAEEAEQDQYHWRAVRIWSEGRTGRQRDGDDDGPGYSSGLNITFDS